MSWKALSRRFRQIQTFSAAQTMKAEPAMRAAIGVLSDQAAVGLVKLRRSCRAQRHDDNKRTAWVLARLFLRLNESDITFAK